MSSDQPAAIPNPPTAAPEAEGPIVARAGSYYRRTRYILAFVMIGYAVWCLRDGFSAWPRDNLIARQHGYDKPPHNDYDIMLNKALGIILPVLGVTLVAWMLQNSRGELRLEGKRLTVPGHPPMSLDEIDSVDRSKWERKGIAIVNYRLGSGKRGSFRLDDFHYQQTPTDQIFKQIEAALLAPKAPPAPKVAAIPAAPRPTRIPPRPRMGA